MTASQKVRLGEYLDRFTLIVGEVNRGKTTLTQTILNAFFQEDTGPMVIVDLAPSLRRSDGEGMARGVGGRLVAPESPCLHYIHGSIAPPRLRGKDERESIALALENRDTAEALFQEAQPLDGKTLFINDCSLYLHAGDPNRLLQWIRSARAAIVNGYFGQSLGPGRLSDREREGMEYLIKACDRLIRL